MINLNEYDNFFQFSSAEEKLEKLKEWKLISNKAKEEKAIMYKGAYTENEVICEIIGYIIQDVGSDVNETVVIQINEETHKINPVYLKQMQSKNFSMFSSDTEE